MYCFNCGENINEQKHCHECGLQQTKASNKKNLKSFKDYVSESRSRDLKQKTGVGSKKKTDNNVTIHVGLLHKVKHGLRQLNSSRTPVLVDVDFDYTRLKRAAFDKLKRYVKHAMADFDYCDLELCYRCGESALHIPGTTTEFTLKKYKEDCGSKYSQITLYLKPYDHETSDEDQDEEEREKDKKVDVVQSFKRSICQKCHRSYVGNECVPCLIDEDYDVSLATDRQKINPVEQDGIGKIDKKENESEEEKPVYLLRANWLNRITGSNTNNGQGTSSSQDDDQEVINISSSQEGETAESSAAQNHDHSYTLPVPEADQSIDEEVMITKNVTIHRMLIKSELLKIFSQSDILSYNVTFTVLDVRGKQENGEGSGVSRDILCVFWEEFLTSCSMGCEEVVPSVRHDMTRQHWEAVGRLMLFGLRVGHFPIRISLTFLISVIFGEEALTESSIINSFKRYITADEKETIENYEKDDSNDQEIKTELITTLDSYKTFSNPTKAGLNCLLKELGHQELIQKPRYMANCFQRVFFAGRLNKEHPFRSLESLEKLYTDRQPTNRKVVNSLKPSSQLTESQSACFNYLTRFIKSLSKDRLLLFLRFVTGSDIMPENSIVVDFKQQSSGMPFARTCVPMLSLSSTYDCYNMLAEEFTNIILNKESYSFLVI